MRPDIGEGFVQIVVGQFDDEEVIAGAEGGIDLGDVSISQRECHGLIDAVGRWLMGRCSPVM